MVGPVRFVFAIIWIGIFLGSLGTLSSCTRVMLGYAVEAQQDQYMSLSKWNRKLVERQTERNPNQPLCRKKSSKIKQSGSN